MTDSNTMLIWVVLFRTMQTALESTPTLLCGIFVAGLIRGMIGADVIRQWFTNDARLGPVRAWLTGLILPVCSFGVLPIAWELKRAGVPRATVITFLLAAPVANPFSLIYAFQTLESESSFGVAALALLLVGSFVITVGTGVLLGIWQREWVATSDVPPRPATGPRRIGVVGLTIARSFNGDLPLYLAIGMVGAGLLGLIPGGALELAVNDRTAWQPSRVLSVSIPFQATPDRGAAVVCEALLSGVSIGSVFIFFLLGIGTNIGMMLWIMAVYGFRTFAIVIPLLVVGALALGSTLPVSLPNTTTDGFRACHFLEIEARGGYKVARARAMRTTVTNDTGEPQWFLIGASAALGAIWLAGLITNFLGEKGTVSYVMTHGAVVDAGAEKEVWSKPLSVPQRTLAGMALVIVLVVAGLYIYYPAPVELLNRMDDIQIELAILLKAEIVPRQQAIRLVNQWQRLQNKLAVADLLRRSRVDGAVRTSTAELRIAINRLRTAMNDGTSPEQLRTLCHDARDSSALCRKVLLEQHRSL
jgi:uncharacterized membrane protein YraQ (UPF0718 family)